MLVAFTSLFDRDAHGQTRLMHVDSTTARVNNLHIASLPALWKTLKIVISPACFGLPLTANFCDNSLCKPASGPNYFSGFNSATETYGLHPQRILSPTAILALVSIFIFRCPPQAGVQLLCVDSPKLWGCRKDSY